MKLFTLIQRLLNFPRFLPLYLALWRARANTSAPVRIRPPAAWGEGISVLIPESGTPELLAQTLSHAELALAQLDEPAEIVVMVNGAAATLYQPLQTLHPQVVWRFAEQALGFNGAIEAGLQAVQYPAVYLLNSDMRLAPDALAQLLPYRMPSVFALASQIFFPPQAARREETGWSDYYDEGGRTYTYEKTPTSATIARGTLYASGGSSLFKTELLKEYVHDSRAYSPFYWEDADWGVRAWAEGLECFFIPTSTAVHEHRGTIKRRFPKEEIDRIVDRNGILFELRHHLSWLDGLRAVIHLAGRPAATQQELSSRSVANGVVTIRRQSLALQRLGFQFNSVTHKYLNRPHNPALPTALWVTPFSVFPPAHGGARRIAELAQRIAQHVNLILLSDEMSSYQKSNPDDFYIFQSAHLIQGRQDKAGQTASDLLTRMQTHSPQPLRYALQYLQKNYHVDLVQVEFMEATRLVEARIGNIPFVASLHDVYLDGGDHDAVQREVLARYDAVLTCSNEDATHLAPIAHHLVPNGASDRLATAIASPATDSILFMGPFRYQPNFDGILSFLTHCWPTLIAACPSAQLTILAGVEATKAEYQHPFLQLPGITVISTFVDPTAYLANCTLTINPQQEIRGSALKVAESLLALRVCVSTQAGARGFTHLQGSALQITNSWQTMTSTLIALLQQNELRHQHEQSALLDRQQLSWDGQAERLLHVYKKLLPAFTTSNTDTRAN